MGAILLSMPAKTTYPSLKGKIIYITGGATGIGASLVQAFLNQSSTVIFNDILVEAGEKLCKNMKLKYGDNIFFDPVDVRDIESLQTSIYQTEEKFSRIDVLINNVANDVRHDPLEICLKQWDNLMSVNLSAAFFASQAALKKMVKFKSGNIINLGSINEYITPEDLPAYVAAKSGISALSKALAQQYGKYDVRVNTIVPGWVATPKQLAEWLTPEKENYWESQVAIPGRIMPENVANLALFLASNDSAFITGQSIVIDAGRT